MIGEQAPLGRENQKSTQNEFQTIKSAFSGGTLIIRAQDHHWRSGSSGLWRLTLERSHEAMGRTVLCWIYRWPSWPPPAYSPHLCDGITPLQAAGMEGISMPLFYRKYKNANSWQRGNGQKCALIFGAGPRRQLWELVTQAHHVSRMQDCCVLVGNRAFCWKPD